ncbi:MAG: aspartate--tRNA(Asn) ligase [Candidatus Pacebacteria bacterium]|nr:aspartate--tRNA(Asn) ligase [Candidatus Paceibacterota bacterium]
MRRTLAAETTQKIGQKIRLAGWVNRRRNHGKLIFVDLRDRSGIVQLVGGKELDSLRPEDVIEVSGSVKKRSFQTVNPKLKTGQIEIEVEKNTLLSPAESLPFDMSQSELKLELPTLLDHRSLTLRHPKIKAIFRVQEVIIQAFREKLLGLGFAEFQAPTLVPGITEGGAEVFPVRYFDHEIYLGQSPQLYKQIAVSVFERGFTVGRAYRAEPSVTTRHLTEYISLDCEFGFINDWTELMDVAEIVVRHIMARVGEKCPEELKMYQVALPEFGQEIPRIKLQKALEIIYGQTGVDNRGEPDLSPEDERELTRWSKEKYGSDFVFVTHYPTKKRPFYTYPDPEDPELTLSFDLVGTGFEWITGGQRIHNYQQLVENIKKWGNRPEDFEIYLQAFKYGMPPEGGWCIGAERATQGILGLANIRQASLFPRDMERVDVRLSALRVKKVKTKKNVLTDLIKLLKDKRINYQLLKHKAAFTSEESTKVRKTRLEQGAKALVMFADKKPVLLVLSAANKVDSRLFKKAFGFKDLKMAAPEEVKEITGVEIGAVPPFGNLFNLKTFIDEGLGRNREIVFNAGSHTRSVRLTYRDFCLLAKPAKGRFAK